MASRFHINVLANTRRSSGLPTHAESLRDEREAIIPWRA
jgi:hypothetical protein